MADASVKDYVFRKGAAKRIPVSGTFELTSRCNLNCKMCYIHRRENDWEAIKQELSTEEWIGIGEKAVSEGMIYLLLTGGEPTLRRDFTELYRNLIKMGLIISVNTNGTAITDEILKAFLCHTPEKVNITLYGFSDETYGSLCGSENVFNRVINNIRMLKKAGVNVIITTTFTRYNIGDMNRIIEFAKSEKIPVRMSAYLFPPVRGGYGEKEVFLTAEMLGKASAYFDIMTMDDKQKDKRREYINKCLAHETVGEMPESKISSCMAGRGAFWITWDGMMYPCGMLPDYACDVRKLGFHDAWKGTCESVNKLILPKECSVCQYKPLCPTCAALTKSVNHATDEVVSDMCVRTKNYVETFLSYEM